MWLSDTRIDKTTRRGLTALVFNGVFGFSWDTLTSGAFLAGFAVAAGAGNLTIGLLAAIPLLAQVLQIPAVLWLERWRRPRRMILAIGPFSRGLWLLLALVPLLFTGGSAVNALIVVLFVASCSGAFLGVAWNTLVRLFVPEHIMGRYFSYRLRVAVGATVVVGLLAGFFVDWWRGRHPDAPLSAYSFVFGAGALFALLSLLFLFRVPERELPPAPERASSAKVLTEPLHDRNFRSLLVFMFLWGFGINLALPFFAVYLLRRLGFPLSTVVIFTTVSQLSFILFVNAWGRLADLVGNRAVLYTCGLLLVLMVLAFPFSGLLVSHYALLITFLVVIHIFSGMAIGGVTLASSNIALKLSPTGSAHTYLAVNGMVASAAGAMAPLIAGFLGDFFAARSFAVRISWTSPRSEWATNILNFQGLDFVFLLAALLAGFALHRLAFVKEEGAATERLGIEQVAHELTREVKDVTSIGGLRNLVTFPIT
ncbi:MAG: MFS transporter, partial [Chloroflexota bacterium]|nr:MFS transporter [Chloroflexota bacterium]